MARAPALSALSLDQAAGRPVVCKAESLQRTGSFKFRGAYHHASSLPTTERAGGLIGASSGNHAQALALAARLLEVPATVVIPADAPSPTVEGIRALGGRVVTYRRGSEDRDALAAGTSPTTPKPRPSSSPSAADSPPEPPQSPRT